MQSSVGGSSKHSALNEKNKKNDSRINQNKNGNKRTKNEKHRLGTKVVIFLLEVCSQKAILCLHSIMAVQAVITAKDI